MNNNRHQLIIRDRTVIPQMRPSVKQRYTSYANGGNSDAGYVQLQSMNNQFMYPQHSSLPQIAIKRKNSDSPSTTNTEVVLLNGNWDTSNKIPNIVAEMHNVNIEELQALQNNWPSKILEPSNTKFDLGNCVTPSPIGSDSGIEGDYSEGNLSWLLNYKIHELPPVPDCGTVAEQNQGVVSQRAPKTKYNQIYVSEPIPVQFNNQHNGQEINAPRGFSERQPNLISKDNSLNFDGYRYSGFKKPPFTYTELIEHALNEKGELTVSGIYQWISDHFPFYKQNDDRWKNSVRHNLSINPHFRKGGKAIHGAGHLWTIAQHDDKKSWNIKKQRMQQFIKDYCNDREFDMELQAATASIMPDGSNNESIDQDLLLGDNDPQDIEIEYVNVIDVTDGLEEFLCPPVPKDQMVQECGLSGDFLITDLNPSSFGINFSDAELINSANLYDDLNFQCFEMQAEQ